MADTAAFTPSLDRLVGFAATRRVTQVMGGHVDVMATSAASQIAHIQGGKLRGIAVSGPRRLGGAFAEVPTWKEQGMDSVYANWRGVIGPKGMSAAQIAYWDDVFSRLTQTPEWRTEAQRLLQDPVYLNSQETRRFLDGQQQELRAVLVELGLAK